jgi:prepilin-type N-terminal cleavage/methylation domain-containing protein
MSHKVLQKKTQRGFTIIEVMIVLAIAGLILAIVLIAIPQLQRNQRNQARRDVANRIAGEISTYAGNNGGAYPTEDANATTGFTGGFATRYLSGGNFNDPETGSTVVLVNGSSPAAPAKGTVYYNVGALCNGELNNGTGNARQFAITIGLEGGAGFCADNG